MKITGPNSLTAPGVGQGGKRTAAGGFAVKGDDAAPAALSRSMGVGGVGSIDALLALQQVEEPLERRRRAIGRAGRMLDMLDRIKLALLQDDLNADDLHRLTAAVREERAATGDPGLESLLDQIETRAAVELAKLEKAA